MKLRKPLTAVAAACALGVALSACGSESTAEAKSDFCTSLDEFSSTVMSYDGLDPSTATNDELDSAEDDIVRAWEDVQDEADDWTDADDNALADAYDDLYWAIQYLPGSNTAEDNLEDLEDELEAMPAAFHETFDGSGCTTA